MPKTEVEKKSLGSGQIRFNLHSGCQLGKYRLSRRLGTGGTCEVWKARDKVEGIWVALKVPLVGLNGYRDNDALLREVRAVSRLRHPFILSVKNADIISGHVVLATELSTGTLADCTKPMSVKRIISIIVQVLEGLTYAHRNRMVHCDVTPGNIFLFPGKRAAIGDFGIALKVKGRIKTIDEFGTPGYVAPEQAYGYPTYSSDCFAIGLILYEYVTGVLPCWPFDWPFRGYRRLRDRTNLAFVKFIKKSLSVHPRKRFANAGKMLAAMLEAIPETNQEVIRTIEKKENNWRKVRREIFIRRYGRVFPVIFRCLECDESIDERMQICPWCGTNKNRFDSRSQFSHICPRCYKGLSPKWRFCPWCYGPGFDFKNTASSSKVRYHGRCRHCGGKLIRFMRYCPWCHRKVRQTWDVRPFPEVCGRCNWPVDTNFWNYCPWCKQDLRQ